MDLQRWSRKNLSSQLKHNPLAQHASCSARDSFLIGKGDLVGGVGSASRAGGVGNKGGFGFGVGVGVGGFWEGCGVWVLFLGKTVAEWEKTKV